MSNLPIDARAILEYLNDLGYRNISAEQLKEFMKDLRKLIKYEERFGIDPLKPDYFDLLHRHATVSFRAKVKDKENAAKLLPTLKPTGTSPETTSNKMSVSKAGAAGTSPAIESRCLPLDKQPPTPFLGKGNDPKRLPRSVPLMTISSQNEINGPLLYLPSDCSINIPDTSMNELRNRFEETMKFPFAQCERTRFQRNTFMLRKGDCGAQVHKKCDQCELPPYVGTGHMRCLAQCSAAPAGVGKAKGKKGKKKKKFQSEESHGSWTPRREEGGFSPDEDIDDRPMKNGNERSQPTKHVQLLSELKTLSNNKNVDTLEKQKNEILSKFNSRELLETLEEVVLREEEAKLSTKAMPVNKQPLGASAKSKDKKRETPYVDLDGIPSHEAFKKMQKLMATVELSTAAIKKSLEVKEKRKENELPSVANRARQSAVATSATKPNGKANTVTTVGRQSADALNMAGQRKKRELTLNEIAGTKCPNIEEKKVKKPQRASSKGPETCNKDKLSHTGATSRRSSSQNKVRKTTSQDPVSLYHYYRRQWQQFRNQIPGEDRLNLRRPLHGKSRDEDK